MRSLSRDPSFFSAFFLTYDDLGRDSARQHIARSAAILDHVVQLILASHETTLALDIPYMERDLCSFILHRRPAVEDLQQMERLVFAVLTNADHGEPTAEDVSFRMSVCDNFCLCVMSEFLHRYKEAHIDCAYEFLHLMERGAFARYDMLAAAILDGSILYRDDLYHAEGPINLFIRRMFAAMQVVALMANDVEPVCVWPEATDSTCQVIAPEAQGLWSAITRRLCAIVRRFLGKGR